MENLKLWAFSLCGALVITSIFRLIISGSRLEKSVNIFLSVFIFLYSVLPLNNLNNIADVSFNIEEEKSLDVIYNDGYEKIVTESIEKVCNENGFVISSVDVDSYLDDNGYYCINKIIIKTDSPDQKDNIISILKQELDFEVEVN